MHGLTPLPSSLARIADWMEGFPAPWGVGGGWAVDLFLGRETRPHADVDLVVFRDDQALLRRHLAGWRFQWVRGGVFHDWREGERLSLPVHEIHARAPDGSAAEFLLNERDGGDWVFRRDPSIRCPASAWIGGVVPALCPAIALLYKAKQPRPHDEHDFHEVAPALPPERRAWLRAALERVHPGHLWLGEL